MNDETDKLSHNRMSSATSKSDFSQYACSENELDDPISAYFKQRCANSSKLYFQKQRESDSSSVGIIDVDNISLFGDDDENERENFRLSSKNSIFPPDVLKNDKKSPNKKKYSDLPKVLISEAESNLDKQRALAQKALYKFCNKDNESQMEDSQMMPEKPRESKALSDISSKLFNSKVSLSKEGENKDWFQPNYSPNTPRYFNDELSSFGGEDIECLPTKNEIKSHQSEKALETKKKRESSYNQKINSMLKDLNLINLNSDVQFESCSKEEQINRLKEDEEKFKLENSALLHNSEISQFSGVAGDDNPEWTLEIPEFHNKKSSIGQFFNKRSNRVSSLVGSVGGSDISLNNLKLDSVFSSLTDCDVQNILKNDHSLPVNDSSNHEKVKPRRCLSTYDLKRATEPPRSGRNSNVSCSSNSTLMIQNILAEMESGLSGTQIYEKLMKSYGKTKSKENDIQKKPKKVNELLQNNETPKSSKTSNRKESANKNRKEEPGAGSGREFQKESQKLIGNRDSQKTSSKFEMKTKKPSITESLKVNQNISLLKDEKRVTGKKGFDASTPKLQVLKSQNEKFKTACSKVLMNDEDWEAPRVSSIQAPVDPNRSVWSDENDKTVIINSTNSSGINKKNCTIEVNDTITVEDTLVVGDLTVLSQRIDEMKGDGVCIVRSEQSEEPVLLTVVQKLADLPKGSIDCSALTPLLRDQFPELLSTFPTPTADQTMLNNVLTPPPENMKDAIVSEPGSWVKLPATMGYDQKINICVEVKKKIFIPITNTSQNWLLVSIESLVHFPVKGGKLSGVKKNDEWVVMDFMTVGMRVTIIPPDSQQSLQVYITSTISTKLDIKLTFGLKQILGQEVQSRSLLIRTNSVNPINSINVIPKDSINFGVIGDQCADTRTVQISYDGICQLPVAVLIPNNDSQPHHFSLKRLVSSSGSHREGESKVEKFSHVFHEGEKQLLEFEVIFEPNILLDNTNKIQEFSALLILKIGTETKTDGVLHKIPIKGAVGFAKFLCRSNLSPLVFRVEKGQSLTRSYPLKNHGSIPLALSVKIVDKETGKEDEDYLFVAPKLFYLSANEESSIKVTFTGKSNESFTKRLLVLQIMPNGRAQYDVELIGIIASENRPLSRASSTSASTTTSETVPIKLLTTAHSLSWVALTLEKEVRQTFQLKNASSITATVRISFKKNLESFKLLNENGEKVQKVRKILKPNYPYTVTVLFRPDLVGAHHNHLIIETNKSCGKKMVSLSGVGGVPNLFVGNIKSDLNGGKILRLQNSSYGQTFSNTLIFTNNSRIPGFVLIKPSMEVLSLSHELVITPSCCVVGPDSEVVVKLSQILKSDDLHSLLSGKDISKIATLSIIMGDEPSRLRLRKLIDSGKLEATERLKFLTAPYYEEREINLKLFDDSPTFENQFLKSLKILEVAVVVERISGVCEPTILIDEDDSIDDFVTICSAIDNTVISTENSRNPIESEPRSERPTEKSNYDWDRTIFSTEPMQSHQKITKWLEALECP